MKKPTLEKPKSLFPKVLKEKKKGTKKKNKESSTLYPQQTPPYDFPNLSLPQNSNKNRSLVCSHLFIVHCKLS